MPKVRRLQNYATTLLLILVGLPFAGQRVAAKPPLARTPQEVARGFYHTYGRLAVRGVPSERQRSALAPYLSADLVVLLARTQQLRDAIERAVNPPLTPQGRMAHIPGYEGDPFTSHDEYGARTFSFGPLRQHHQVIRLPVYLTNEDIKWTDELIMRRTTLGWVIDDIAFTSDRKNLLYTPYRRTLRRYLQECLKCWPNDRYRGKLASSLL